MFDEISKYKNTGHFFFKSTDSLEQVCNAPTDKSGVYIVYALKNGRIELIFIGSSGKVEKDGSLFIIKAGLGGIKEIIVNGYPFVEIPRSMFFQNKMIKEKIDALDIYWFVTHNNKYIDCPKILENKLLKKYFEIYGRLPKWNEII